MEIPILTFHDLSQHSVENKYVITEENFTDHLEYLASHNYNCILPENYCVTFFESAHKLPDKSVMITFDDGHESNYTIALPILKKYNFKATFFITTDFIDQVGYMTSRQINLLRDSGMSVQSHAKTHLFLNELNNEQIRIELDESKKKLEDILGKPVQSISMPGGRYNNSVIELARQINYLALFCSNPYYFKKLDGISIIGRCMIKCAYDESNFYEIIRSIKIDRQKAQLLYYLKYFLKKSLGKRIYYLLWKLYINK